MKAIEAAKKAQDFLDRAREESTKTAKLRVSQAIERSAEAGKFSVTVDLGIPPDIKVAELLAKELSSDGYEVSFSASTLQIDWDQASAAKPSGWFK